MSQKKNNPVIRTCVICREKFLKSELLRFMISDQMVFDVNQNMPGRGYYLCWDDLLNIKGVKRNPIFKSKSAELLDMVKAKFKKKIFQLCLSLDDQILKSEVLDLLEGDFKLNFEKVRKSLVVNDLSIVKKIDDMLLKLNKIYFL